MSESPDDSQSEPTEIEDPESYVNHRRLKSIFDIRERLHEQRTQIVASRHDRSVSEYESLSAYRALVSSYIVETEPIFGRFDGGNELLTKSDFGETVVTPRTSYEFSKPHGNQDLTLDVSADPDIDANRVDISWQRTSSPQEELEKVYSHDGLVSLLNHPDPLVGQWDIPVKLHDRYHRHNHTVKQQVGFQVLDTMVRAINNYLAQIGFEVSPNDEQDNLHLSLDDS